jgi:pseudaminic acid synthase
MISIQGKKISTKEKPFIIAEMSGNHNGSIDKAIALVDCAAKAGVDAIKLQTYTADTLTLNIKSDEFMVLDPNSIWYGKSLYELYSEGSTPWKWHEEIIARASQKGLICFSSPFDISAVDFLETLNISAYKIASSEIIDHELINYVAKTGKPMIISTGMATLSEIAEAIEVCHLAGNKNIALLQCTASYPTSPENSNIRTIPNMREVFGCEVGLSDHTMGVGAAVGAVALGATIIEKHFTLNRSDGGIDAAFSLEPNELAQLVVETERVNLALGKVFYGPSQSEISGRNYRRSLYASEDIKVGEIFTRENVRSIRPGFGLHPKYLGIIIGRKAKFNLCKGSPISFNDI